MMGTLTNSRTTIPWNNPNAPEGVRWIKAYDTDLDPIVKDSVIVTELPDADGKRMVGVSDDKDEKAPVLAFSRVEFTIFVEGVRSGQFDQFRATDEDMTTAGKAPTRVGSGRLAPRAGRSRVGRPGG
ncbi:hypothetical protein ABH940_002127 [Streptacidiphilus sp. BW17]|uniref:DUF397 domain-containing protein n=1 Tax=Streptacidiphilus sp. BW17 TaxID=3156274 RepID=UPI003516C0BA